MDNVFIFPNSLFENNKLIDKNSKVWIIEHPVYFTKYKFHKMKLILHRSSMKYYQDYIRKKYKCRVKYIEFNDDLDKMFKDLKNKKVHFHDPVDHHVVKNMKSLAKKYNIELQIHDTPMFLSNLNDLNSYAKNKKRFYHDNFYKWQRNRLNVLMKNSKPRGGKWSFDVQNREPFPENFKENYIPKINTNKYVREAKKYANKNFKNNPGNTDLYLPIDHRGAKNHFKRFLKDRFKCFGPYQDAVDKNIPFGCHSVISPLLNIGLLEPKYVVEKAEEYGIKNRIPMQSLEGFIRQVVGWREFTRMMYMFKRKEFEQKNHFNHKRKLNKKIWFENKGTTGFEIMDDMIDKVFKYGYLHHIERLMYIGNWMLINKINPDHCFDWFMVFFIDSYSWVMYSNVYGMSQYSAGDIMMTRPYFSSSSYIDRMSTYKKRKDVYQKIKLNDEDYEWFQVWDSLYYNFIDTNKKEFSKNYAIARQVKHWKDKSETEKKKLKKIANVYMDKY